MPHASRHRLEHSALVVALAFVANAAAAHVLSAWVMSGGAAEAATAPVYSSVELVLAERTAEPEAEEEQEASSDAEFFVLAPIVDEQSPPERELDEVDVVSDRDQRVTEESLTRNAVPADLVASAASAPDQPAPSLAGAYGDVRSEAVVDDEPSSHLPPVPSPNDGVTTPIPDAEGEESDDEALPSVPPSSGGDEGVSEQGEVGGVDWSAFRADMRTGSNVFASPPSVSVDVLDVAEGDRTVLNTRRVRYWSFMQRLTERVQDVWDPNRAWRSFDPSFDEIERQEYLTIVDFAINRHGEIQAVEVRRPSGVRELDREAVRAIDSAAPFRNVPEALLDTDGIARIGFYFTFDARARSGGLRWQRR